MACEDFLDINKSLLSSHTHTHFLLLCIHTFCHVRTPLFAYNIFPLQNNYPDRTQRGEKKRLEGTKPRADKNTPMYTQMSIWRHAHVHMLLYNHAQAQRWTNTQHSLSQSHHPGSTRTKAARGDWIISWS